MFGMNFEFSKCIFGDSSTQTEDPELPPDSNTQPEDQISLQTRELMNLFRVWTMIVRLRAQQNPTMNSQKTAALQFHYLDARREKGIILTDTGILLLISF